MGWLREHLDKFVIPVLSYEPPAEKVLLPEEMAVVKNIWRSAKHAANGNPVLLPGRDVWLFEVLARRENFPTIFRPDISRLTAKHVKEDYSKCFILDTGYIGSIPVALGTTNFLLASGKNQVFPKLTGARSLVLKLEYLPKYWKRGFLKHEAFCSKNAPLPDYSYGRYDTSCDCSPSITQDISTLEEFAKAAALTKAIYTDSSPAFIATPKPVGNPRPAYTFGD